MVVLAAVPGFLAVAVAVAHGFPPRVLHALVVPAAAAVRALPLPAAGLGGRHEFAAEKREAPAKDDPAARRAPSVRSRRHRVGCFPGPPAPRCARDSPRNVARSLRSGRLLLRLLHETGEKQKPRREKRAETNGA